MEAIRDHSAARGATRTVGFVLASYAAADGGSVYPSIETIRKGTGRRVGPDGKKAGGVTRKTVVDARRWFVEHGEAIIVGTRPSHTGTPVPVLDFSPLLREGSLSEPEPEGNDQGEPEDETEYARGARGSSLSPSASTSQPSPAAQLAAERRDDEVELATLEEQLPRAGSPQITERCIAELRERLGLIPSGVAA